MSTLPPHMPSGEPPEGAVLADLESLGHINTYADLPPFTTSAPSDRAVRISNVVGRGCLC